jgi:hypothetical protein
MSAPATITTTREEDAHKLYFIALGEGGKVEGKDAGQDSTFTEITSSPAEEDTAKRQVLGKDDGDFYSVEDLPPYMTAFNNKVKDSVLV